MKVEIINSITGQSTVLKLHNQLIFWDLDKLCVYNPDYHEVYERHIIKDIQKKNSILYIDGVQKDNNYLGNTDVIDTIGNLDIPKLIKAI